MSWAAGIDPFPTTPTVAFHVNNPDMTAAFAPVTVSTANHLCAALVDLTGYPAMPPYAGLNDEEMIYPGSLPKICAMYAAFALRSRVQAFVDAAKANGAPVVSPGITSEIEQAWKPKLQALFPTRPATSFGNNQDITFPKLDEIFTFSPAGVVDFASAPLTIKWIDEIGELGVPQGQFHDWMRLMLRWSNDTAASMCILALGYFYINGALAQAGLFDSATSNGLWLSADYAKHDWVETEADRLANAAGQPLTSRWATAQATDGRPRQRSNITATAAQVARFMTLLAQGMLVDADANHADPSGEMRALLQAAVECVSHPLPLNTRCGVGSYVKDALYAVGRLDAVGRWFTTLAAKKGFGDDRFSHECAIVERTVGGNDLRYVVVGLGSAPDRNRTDLSDLFVLLDEIIVTLHSYSPAVVAWGPNRLDIFGLGVALILTRQCTVRVGNGTTFSGISTVRL